ncbi:MAG TPA: ChbG/HpnK family deacetylase [Planctomycetota bacterium]|jgi:hypothetical protein
MDTAATTEAKPKKCIRLVTRADDAGSSQSANRAILETFEKGIARNVSVIACGPQLEHAAELFRNVKGLCVGLHVTLNCEWESPRWGPVLPRERVPSLIEHDGTLTRHPQNLHDRHANVNEMVAEVYAQLQRLREAGLLVRYIDEHMGVGWVCNLWQKLADLARDEGLVDGVRRVKDLPPAAQPQADIVADLLARLDAAPSGTYTYFAHPTYDDDEMRAFHGMGQPAGFYGPDRDAQRRVFLDERVLSYCEENNVKLIRYLDI